MQADLTLPVSLRGILEGAVANSVVIDAEPDDIGGKRGVRTGNYARANASGQPLRALARGRPRDNFVNTGTCRAQGHRQRAGKIARTYQGDAWLGHNQENSIQQSAQD